MAYPVRLTVAFFFFLLLSVSPGPTTKRPARFKSDIRLQVLQKVVWWVLVDIDLLSVYCTLGSRRRVDLVGNEDLEGQV